MKGDALTLPPLHIFDLLFCCFSFSQNPQQIGLYLALLKIKGIVKSITQILQTEIGQYAKFESIINNIRK